MRCMIRTVNRDSDRVGVEKSLFCKRLERRWRAGDGDARIGNGTDIDTIGQRGILSSVR